MSKQTTGKEPPSLVPKRMRKRLLKAVYRAADKINARLIAEAARRPLRDDIADIIVQELNHPSDPNQSPGF